MLRFRRSEMKVSQFERKRSANSRASSASATLLQAFSDVNADSAFGAEFPISIYRKYGSDFQPRFDQVRANLPLAARPCVGHIGPDGAVAEWLKAAVC